MPGPKTSRKWRIYTIQLDQQPPECLRVSPGFNSSSSSSSSGSFTFLRSSLLSCATLWCTAPERFERASRWSGVLPGAVLVFLGRGGGMAGSMVTLASLILSSGLMRMWESSERDRALSIRGLPVRENCYLDKRKTRNRRGGMSMHPNPNQILAP
jgi:hypothetical protein